MINDYGYLDSSNADTSYYSYNDLSTGSTTYYTYNGSISVNTRYTIMNTILELENVDYYWKILASIETALMSYIWNNITKRKLMLFGKSYAYDKIENVKLAVIIMVLKNQIETNDFHVEPDEYSKIIKRLYERVDNESLYDIVDQIYDSQE